MYYMHLIADRLCTLQNSWIGSLKNQFPVQFIFNPDGLLKSFASQDCDNPEVMSSGLIEGA